jgi:2-polyprenyl-3-methyl-5-hydroxy-6-metoxy-1,4-benzoquinol methylase
VFVGRIQEYLAGNPQAFDCIILTDVIEHFDKQEGLQVIQQLQAFVRHGGSLLVGTPAEFVDQGFVHGNPLEQHRSHWTADDLQGLGFEILLNGSEAQTGFDKALLAVWSPGN